MASKISLGEKKSDIRTFLTLLGLDPAWFVPETEEEADQIMKALNNSDADFLQKWLDDHYGKESGFEEDS